MEHGQKARAFRVGVAGPVGSGKTALVDYLSRQLWPGCNLAVVINEDGYSRLEVYEVTADAQLGEAVLVPELAAPARPEQHLLAAPAARLAAPVQGGSRYILYVRPDRFAKIERDTGAARSEEVVAVTEDGYERLSTYGYSPFE